MLLSAPTNSLARSLILCAAYSHALPQIGADLNSINFDLTRPNLRDRVSPDKQSGFLSEPEFGSVSDIGNVGTGNDGDPWRDAGNIPQSLPLSPVENEYEFPFGQHDEIEPARNAEMVGVMTSVGAGSDYDNSYILILVNEYGQKWNIVRQSICYVHTGPNPRYGGFSAPCFDTSGYEVVRGFPHTLTIDQYFMLHKRVKEIIGRGAGMRQTMTALFSYIHESMPCVFGFTRQGWRSLDIRIDDQLADCVRTAETDEEICLWRRADHESGAIRPYSWAGLQPVDPAWNDPKDYDWGPPFTF